MSGEAERLLQLLVAAAPAELVRQTPERGVLAEEPAHALGELRHPLQAGIHLPANPDRPLEPALHLLQARVDLLARAQRLLAEHLDRGQRALDLPPRLRLCCGRPDRLFRGGRELS